MPSANDILKSLAFLARNYLAIAILWHVVIYGLFFFLMLIEKKPSNRFVGSFLAVPLFSVSFFAWSTHNPFSGVLFLLVGSLLVIFSLSAEQKKITLNPSYVLRAAGIVILFFGMTYPHFLGPLSFIYLYAAPVGIIPCATLLMVTGFSLFFLLKQSQKWMGTLFVANLFYGLFGLLRLHVYIDVLLLFASGLLLIQMILQRRGSGDSEKKPEGKRSSLLKPEAAG